MGRGRRLLKWLGRRLLSQNTKAQRYRKEMVPTSQENISDSFSDVSVINYLPSECSEPPQQPETEIFFSRAMHSNLNSDKGCSKYYPDHTTFPSIMKTHGESATLLHAKPVLDITTSRQGNIAFEVPFSKKPKPIASKCFSSTGNHRTLSHTRWEERLKIAKKHQSHLQFRCESLKERRLMAANVRRRIMANAVKPSLLPATPDTPVGVDLEMPTDVNRSRTAKPSWLLKMEKALDKSKNTGEVLEKLSGVHRQGNFKESLCTEFEAALLGLQCNREKSVVASPPFKVTLPTLLHSKTVPFACL